VNPEFANGQILVEVLNPLTSPNSEFGTDVEIIASMRWKNIEFAHPSSDIIANLTHYRSTDETESPQSAFEQDADNQPEGGTPVEPIGNMTLPDVDHTALVFYGEVCPSMRTYLKRYRVVTGSTGVVTLMRPRIATTLTPHEFVLSWYSGWRGSVRYKIRDIGNSGVGDRAAITISRDSTEAQRGSISGAFVNDGCAEVELPFYWNRRFATARAHPDFDDYPVVSSFDPNKQLYGITATGTTTLSRSIAIGEDFSTFFYVGPPLVYDTTPPPDP
jgi:hypothetical protein